MGFQRAIGVVVALGFLFAVVVGQDRPTGTLKGRVHVETGSPAGVAVIVRQGDRELTRAKTDRNGDFTLSGLAPGIYGLTFRKPGLSVGTIDGIEVKAGKTRSFRDLILSIDDGSIAFIRGSVFNETGLSLPNARVELARILDDGTVKKIDGRVTNETGSFVFRLSPDAAKYRVTAKADGRQPASKDVEVDSAAVYRIAISLQPTAK